MFNQLQTRLAELKHEFGIGQTRLQELERQQAQLRETLLRISGAIQVLEELLATPGSQATDTSTQENRSSAVLDQHNQD